MGNGADKLNVPWYRHLWVWLVMIPPASAVVAGFATAWLAGAPPALVVDDYGEIAMATEQRRSRDQRASELGLAAALELSAGGGGVDRLRIALAAGDTTYRFPGELRLRLIHPTRESADQSVTLARQGDAYLATVRTPASRLYVQLEDLDGQWRLVGELPAGSTQLELSAGSGP